MQATMTTSQIAAYTARQIETFFPDGKSIAGLQWTDSVQTALDRVDFCFQHIVLPSYSKDGQSKFDVLHSDQYCIYLYFLSNTIYCQQGNKATASKVFYLNKALHAFNCMYDTLLPDIFFLAHCVGTVLGKAHYENFFVACQNCTVGALAGQYPILGSKLILSAGASIIGRCRLGENVMLAPGCGVFKTDVADNSLVLNVPYGATQDLRIKPNSERPINTFFRF